MPAPAKKATAYTFFVGLVDQANTKLLKANPTLAAGDVKVSKDGGAFANLTTLPTVTPAAGAAVQVSLSSTEMNADNVVVLFSDAAGAEWCDQLISINTSSKTLDDALAISGAFKKNTAVTLPFVMTDATTHALTAGATVTVQRSIDGAAFASGTIGAVTDLGGGHYTVALGAGDMNGTTIALRFSATGFDTLPLTIATTP